MHWVAACLKSSTAEYRDHHEVFADPYHSIHSNSGIPITTWDHEILSHNIHANDILLPCSKPHAHFDTVVLTLWFKICLWMSILTNQPLFAALVCMMFQHVAGFPWPLQHSQKNRQWTSCNNRDMWYIEAVHHPPEKSWWLLILWHCASVVLSYVHISLRSGQPGSHLLSPPALWKKNGYTLCSTVKRFG